EAPTDEVGHDDRYRKVKARIISTTAVDTRDQLSLDQTSFVPRAYQTELFTLAQQHNVLVCLDTGSGKTLISVLLLKHMHNQQSAILAPLPEAERKKRRRVSFFLVNLVPLVHQQSSVIAGNSDLAVGKLYGELKDVIRTRGGRGAIDTWRLPEWTALLESHDVIVSTAQCMLDALIHGFIKMSDINTLIFDEVHHAVKHHPFLRIMKYYQLASLQDRPKIFGMTASPIFSLRAEFSDAASYLQRTMDATIFTASQLSTQELDRVKQRPEELIVEFDAYTQPVEPSQLTKDIVAMFSQREAYPEFDAEIRPKMDYAMLHFGPMMCDLLWHGSLIEHRNRIKRACKRAADNASAANRALLSQSWIHGAEADQIRAVNGLPVTAQLSSNVDLNKHILAHVRSRPPLAQQLQLDASNCSDKILRLVEVLKCFADEADSFCAIVFVERRQTASSLAELISRTPGLEFIHAEWIVGHDSAVNSASGMDWQDQVEVLNRFRHRCPTNLLVATSIAEEGLDIQAANVVIRFDLFSRHISFLQSRGRARARNSKFILMAERGNLDHHKLISNAFHADEARAHWLADVSSKSGAAVVDDADQYMDDEERQTWMQKLQIEIDEDADAPYDSNLCIYEPDTGARLFPPDAPSLVSHYVATLQSEYLKDAVLAYQIDSDEKTATLLGTPVQYTCRLQLPSNSAVREVSSGPCSSKKRAKRLAAFFACRQLRDLGELDQWLMPKLLVPAVSEQEGTATLPVNLHHLPHQSIGVPVHIPLKSMQGWKLFSASHKPDDVFHGTLLPLDDLGTGYQPILLLTRAPLPATKLIRLALGQSFKRVTPIDVGPLPDVKGALLEGIKLATVQMLSRVCRIRIPPVDQLAVLAAPVVRKQGGNSSSDRGFRFDVDSFLQDQTRGRSDWVDAELTDEVVALRNVLIARKRGISDGFGSLYRIVGVRRELSALSKVVCGENHGDDSSQTYLDLFTSTYMSCGLPPQLTASQLSQPLLEVVRVKTCRDLLRVSDLQAGPGNAEAKGRRKIVIPSLYRVHELSFAAAQSALLLPSILGRYDQILLGDAANAALFSSRLDTDLVTKALTSPSLGHEFDYERLEFLGDSFLKLVATCSTFTSLQACNEAELHLANKEILTNKRLFKEASAKRLWQYASLSRPQLGPRRFEMPVLTLSEQSGVDEDDVEMLRTKVISDMVEALIGAGYASAEIEGALCVCHAFQLVAPRISTLGDFNQELMKLKQQSIAEDWRDRVNVDALKHLEALFEYTFTYPHLGLEAFTHPSLLASVLPSYQRLEFLGDAWLDWLVVKRIMDRYPYLGPGELTAIKSSLVSNATFAALAHKLNLHPYIASNSNVLSSSIQNYASALSSLSALASPPPYQSRQYWTHPSVPKPPKSLADLLEASFAAVVVDSGFNPDVAERLFDRLIAGFFDEFCSPDDVLVTDMGPLSQFLGGRTGYDTQHALKQAAERKEEPIESVEEKGDQETNLDLALALDLVNVEIMMHNVVIARIETFPRSLLHLQRA
ncbi:hypothetical protein BCV70DRAFT_150616, partial [Testicularia cyperi]